MNHTPLSDKQKEILNLDRELVTTIIENSPELFKTKEPTLENIQIILNNTPKTAEGGIIALGTAFGDAFLKNGYDFEWMSITDEQGTDMCLKHKTISTTIFPRDMLIKRIEKGEEVDVQGLYDGLVEKIDEILSSGDYL